MMTSLIITGRHVIVIFDNGKEVLSGTFDYPKMVKIVHEFYEQNESNLRKAMYYMANSIEDDDETPDPEKPMPKMVKSSTFDELLDSIAPKKKVATGKILEQIFSDFMPDDTWVPPTTVKVDKNELEEVAENAGIFSENPNPEDLVGGGMEGDSDEYESDYLNGLKAGVHDRTMGISAVYYAGDQLGADSNRHAQYIDGYINGYR